MKERKRKGEWEERIKFQLLQTIIGSVLLNIRGKSYLNIDPGVATKRFLTSGDQHNSEIPPPALYKGVALSMLTSHT